MNGLTLLIGIGALAGIALLIWIVRLVWMLFHDPGEHARPFREPLPLAPPPRHPPLPPQTSLAPFPPAVPPGEPSGTAAAAGVAPVLPPLPEPVPQVDHDEFGPDQFFHYGPPDPAAAGDALPQAAPIPPSPAHHAAVAVGAMIAATHAHLADMERARAAELEAEVQRTRPWAHETGSFELETLRAYEAAVK